MLTIVYNSEAEINNSLSLVFGHGLIGSALINSLKKQLNPLIESYIYPWHSSQDQDILLSNCRKIISTVLKKNDSINRIEIVWAAGKAGFYSSSDDTLNELMTFNKVLIWSEKIFSSLTKDQNLYFTMLSSAGGVYEGLKFIDNNSQISIKRPYGELKINQESTLLNSKIINKKIIRLSSVYGYCNPDQRMGLIPVMINNCIKNKVTNIFGNLDTLRDYIWIEDVCNYIAQMMTQRKNIQKEKVIEILASGKPTSIYEIKNKIEKKIGRKMYLSFMEEKNALNITFAKNALPSGWHPQDFETILTKIINNFYAR